MRRCGQLRRRLPGRLLARRDLLPNELFELIDLAIELIVPVRQPENTSLASIPVSLRAR